MERYGFQTASPESVGIRSEALLRFLDAVERERLEVHSLLLVRRDKLIFDGFWKPFESEKLHRLCSAGKAVVAAAILFAVQERLFGLDDAAAELLEVSCADERGGRVTVYDLLTMHAGHRTDSYPSIHAGGIADVQKFFEVPFEDAPGARFFYDNGIPDVLAAILYGATGQRVSEYLKPRLFEPLGIDEVRVGTEGKLDDLPTFCLKTQDLLKLTDFFYRYGRWNTTQLLDEELARQAVSFLVPAEPEDASSEGNGAHTRGYGFQIWGNLFGGFILDGGCGQMGIGVPELELMMAINANDPMAGRIVQLFWEQLRCNMFSRPLPENEAALTLLRSREEGLTLFPERAAGCGTQFPEETYRFEEPFLGVQRLKLKIDADKLRLTGTQTVTITLDGSWSPCEIPFRFTEMESGGHRKLEHGLRLDTHVGYRTESGYAAGAWQEDGSVLLVFRSDAWMGSHHVKITFEPLGLALTHENGTSWRLRGREGIEKWTECIYNERARASLCSE